MRIRRTVFILLVSIVSIVCFLIFNDTNNVLTVAITNDAAHTILPLIEEYNTNNPKKKIQYTVYGKDKEYLSDSLAEVNNLKNEIQNGDAPDVVIAYNSELDTSSPNFEDLLPYIINDEEIKKNVLPNFLEASKELGQINCLWLDYNLESLLIDTKFQPNSYSTLSDLIQIADKNGMTSLLPPYVDQKTAFSHFTSAYIVNNANYSNVDLTFDTPEFKEILSFCKTLPSDTTINSNKNNSSLLEIHHNPYLIANNESKNHFIGYPISNENKGYYNNNYSIAAICSTSTNKNAAWEFVKWLALNVDHSPFNYSNSIAKMYNDYPKNIVDAYVEELNRTSECLTDIDINLLNIIIKTANEYFSDSLSINDAINIMQENSTNYLQSIK